ncbi:MAG: DUF2807 domain-containing protein [Hyphomonadaceae bacterium]|nr:DUF2807 domain-containing protein [Hyphomonadaceae bacterium]
MNLIALATGAAAVMLLAASAHAETRTLPVTTLYEVEVSGPLEVVITAGPQTSAVLEGNPDAIARIDAKVRGATLDVRGRKRGVGNRDPDVVLRITAPLIRSIDASNGVAVEAKGFATSALELDLSSGAALEIDGRCDRLDAKASMGAALSASKLVCRNVSAAASMGGVAHVHATQSIEGSASMGGVIEIDGAPAQREVSASMGGVVD